MDTIYKLQRRAASLRSKTQTDSITPEEVGGLQYDTLAYLADMEQNLDGLGIRKVYLSVADMQADGAPVGTNGKALRLGQLVTIYNPSAPTADGTGNVYAYQKPGWLLVGYIGLLSGVSADIKYLLQNTYYLQEGIGCAAFNYAMSLGDVPIQSEEVTRQEGDSIILDTSANRFVLERRGKFYTKFLSNGASMQGSDVYANSRHTFLNRQDTSYWYRMADGTLAKGSSTFAIRNWLDTLQDDFDWAETEIVQHGNRLDIAQTTVKELGAFDTFAALFARAAKFDIVSNNAIALLHGTYRQADGIYHGVLILQQVEKNNEGGGTAMQYIYIEKRQYTRYINFSATSVTEVQGVQNHGARNLSLSGRVLQMKNMWGFNVGSSATIPDNGNIYEGTAGTSSVPVVLAKTFGGTVTATLGAATSARAGVMTAADKTKVGNYPEQFVLDLGILNSQSEGENIAAASEVAGNRNISFIRFKVQGVSELKTTLIMQWPNGINETAQIMCVDKAQWRRNVTGATGVKGATTNAFKWERTAPHSIDYDEQRRMIQLKDYENKTVSQEVELPLATSSQHGLMSIADKEKISAMESELSALEARVAALENK